MSRNASQALADTSMARIRTPASLGSLGMPSSDKARVDLGGVPETLLWTTYQRSIEARRPDAVLDDPKAIEVVDRIDYPFEERFGRTGFGQWQALRARCFDDQVRRFLAHRPDGTVVALGEGLETQFWRVDNGRVRWLSVDLGETIDLRDRLLPSSPRGRTLACSALDETWMDEVDPARGLLITAQGLLMYLEPAQVHGLITSCARRLPASDLIFDAVPQWLSALSKRGALKSSRGYQPPPWLWGIDAEEERRIAALHPNITELRGLRFPRGRGVVHGLIMPTLTRSDAIRRLTLSAYRAHFGPSAAASIGSGR